MPSYLSSRNASICVASRQVNHPALIAVMTGWLWRSLGEARDGFFGRVHGRGQHEAQRMEEAHAGLGQCPGEGAADGTGQVGLQHDGVADLRGGR